MVVLGCQWIQVDDATPRSWPLKLAAVWRLSWSFRQSFCHLPEPSTWRSVHHMQCPPARMATASMAGAVKASYPVHAPCPHEITGITRPAVCASAGPWQWPPCVGPGRGTGSRTEEPTWRPLAGRRHVVDMLRAGRYGDRCDRFHPAGMIDRLLLAATCNSRHSAVMTRSSNNAQEVPTRHVLWATTHSARLWTCTNSGNMPRASSLSSARRWSSAIVRLLASRLCVGEVPSGCHLRWTPFKTTAPRLCCSRSAGACV